ncbi:hypothetical protein AAH092_11150 [Bacteroides xylanisolvens]|jgi:hypothetical protein|uniref:hypothetical protein n=1 Tax=Bacteroides xylanisolvens TaxID=371601 RepID=UPI0039B4996B
MILKDIVSLLANRINQPRVIEGYLRKVYAKGYEAGTKQSPWISIDNSFPEDNALVLCSSQIYGKVVLRWNKLAKEWLYPEENHIYCDWDKVDCWMYIPEV